MVSATTGVKAEDTETIVATAVATDARPTDSEAEETEASETAADETVATADKVASRVAVTMGPVEDVLLNVVDPLTATSEEPKASAPATPTTAHLKISERPVRLNEKKTERT